MHRLWGIALSLVLATGPIIPQQGSQPAETPIPGSEMTNKKIRPPRPLNNVEAEYTDEARWKKLDGRCLVGMIVDAYGMPQQVKVKWCTDPVFETPSLTAVAKYRFAPATTETGTAVPVMITVEINFKITGGHESGTPIRVGFLSPPGMTSAEAGADGVYPLSRQITPPQMTKFFDVGYGDPAFRMQGHNSCDVVLTISAKGKPADAQLLHCGEPELEKPALESLLKSHYKAASLNGKSVAVRATARLEYGNPPPVTK